MVLIGVGIQVEVFKRIIVVSVVQKSDAAGAQHGTLAIEGAGDLTLSFGLSV
jgi:hypothetical protein